jgi:HKD family nuclease
MTTVAVAAPRDMLRAVREVVTDADEAMLCVAFANQAGVELLAPALRGTRGPVRMLATTVFGGSTAAALQRAVDLGVDVRVLNLPRGTYHPKLYLSRQGRSGRALVGSANLTSGLVRNIEVATLLSGQADGDVLGQLRELAEQWWHHPASQPWSRDIPAAISDTIAPDLWEELQTVLAPGVVVHTITQQRPNTIVDLTRDGVWIETERSVRLGRGAEHVPAWMLNIAWDYLAANGRLTNSHLLATDGLNVKRSSAVCAILALLPSVEVVSHRAPIELRLVSRSPSAAAAEQGPDYSP